MDHLNNKRPANLERAQKEAHVKTQSTDWVINNRYAIKAYNDFIAEHGCFSDKYRLF